MFEKSEEKSETNVVDLLDVASGKAHTYKRLHESWRQRPNADGEKAKPKQAKQAVTAGVRQVRLNVEQTKRR